MIILWYQIGGGLMNEIALHLDRNDGQTLTEQLYTFLKTEIMNGNISKNEKVPSKRQLALNLECSINTIQGAYNQLVSSRFSDIMWVVEQVVFMSFDRRLAMHLLETAAIAGNDTFAITHDAIAKDLGTAREVVTRMLSRFQEEQLVRLSRGGITLVDREGLYALT